MNDLLYEVFSSIKQHKLRSSLTGFGVAWGIFILIVLLAAGNGFKNGIFSLFEGYSSNSVWITGSSISKPVIGGLAIGAKLEFEESLLIRLKNRFPEIELITPEVSFQNGLSTVTYNETSGRFTVKGIGLEYMQIKTIEIDRSGRNFNNIDFDYSRRNVIIGKQVKDTFFENEDPVGKYINISGIYFLVIGEIADGNIFSSMEQMNIYMPNSTLYETFNVEPRFTTIGVLLNGNTNAISFENELRDFLADEMKFESSDRRAVYINNIQLQVEAFNVLFKGINTFLWILGICFLVTGMIGVTNIMLVSVKERTNEIGIRKAIGATPASIILIIIVEAIIITAIFGLLGLVFGYCGILIYNWIVLSLQTGSTAVFSKGEFDSATALISLLLLIISGTLAGLLPARKAAKIKPIETINASN